MEVLTLGPDATLAQVQQLVTEQRHAMGLDAMPVAMHADVVCADTGQAVQWLQDHANGMVLPAVLYHDEAMRPEPMVAGSNPAGNTKEAVRSSAVMPYACGEGWST